MKSPKRLLMEILPNGKRVLDLGAGNGVRDSINIILRKKGYKIIYAVDKNKNILKENNADLKFSFDLNKRLRFDSNFFDLVIAREIIEHLDNRQEFLQEIYRVLKKNGRLLLTTPNKKCLLGCCEILRGKGWDGWSSEHRYLYTRNEIKNLIIQMGFEIEKDIGLFPIYYINKTFPIKNICADMWFLVKKINEKHK